MLGPIHFMIGSDVARGCGMPKVLHGILSVPGFQSTRLRFRREANDIGSSHKGNDGIGGAAVCSFAEEIGLHEDWQSDRSDFRQGLSAVKQRLMNSARDCFT